MLHSSVNWSDILMWSCSTFSDCSRKSVRTKTNSYETNWSGWNSWQHSSCCVSNELDSCAGGVSPLYHEGVHVHRRLQHSFQIVHVVSPRVRRRQTHALEEVWRRIGPLGIKRQEIFDNKGTINICLNILHTIWRPRLFNRTCSTSVVQTNHDELVESGVKMLLTV